MGPEHSPPSQSYRKDEYWWSGWRKHRGYKRNWLTVITSDNNCCADGCLSLSHRCLATLVRLFFLLHFWLLYNSVYTIDYRLKADEDLSCNFNQFCKGTVELLLYSNIGLTSYISFRITYNAKKLLLLLLLILLLLLLLLILCLYDEGVTSKT
jgi:hypothetical protein